MPTSPDVIREKLRKLRRTCVNGSDDLFQDLSDLIVETKRSLASREEPKKPKKPAAMVGSSNSDYEALFRAYEISRRSFELETEKLNRLLSEAKSVSKVLTSLRAVARDLHFPDSGEV